MSDIYQNNVGVVFQATISNQIGTPVNIGGASGLQIMLLDPNNKLFVFGGILSTNGSDGNVQYTTSSANDLYMCGLWQYQGSAMSSGVYLLSDPTIFRVYPGLPNQEQ